MHVVAARRQRRAESVDGVDGAAIANRGEVSWHDVEDTHCLVIPAR